MFQDHEEPISLESSERKSPRFKALNQESVAIAGQLAKIPVALSAAWKQAMRRLHEIDAERGRILKELYR